MLIVRRTGALAGTWDYNPGYVTYAAAMHVPACESFPAIPAYQITGTFVNVDPYS